VVALIFSTLLMIAMTAVCLLVAKRRPVGAPLTWGEAFVAANYVFVIMFLAYGVVPHQFLSWADGELGWRSDKLGIPTPFGPLFENGLSFFGRGRITLSAVILRDILAAGIYIVLVAVQFYLWLWWQKRGKRTEAQPELTSSYGRPLLRGGA